MAPRGSRLSAAREDRVGADSLEVLAPVGEQSLGVVHWSVHGLVMGEDHRWSDGRGHRVFIVGPLAGCLGVAFLGFPAGEAG